MVERMGRRRSVKPLPVVGRSIGIVRHRNSHMTNCWKRINATDDIGVLVNEVARDVKVSGLSQTEIHTLIKAIAKKTGGTVKTLYNDTRNAGGITMTSA